jgi:hypothetical protein
MVEAAARATLEEHLHRLFLTRSEELGLGYEPVVESVVDETVGASVAISFDDRPVAVGVTAPLSMASDAWASTVAAGVERALGRRLSLLLDDGEKNKHVQGLREATPSLGVDTCAGALAYVLDNGLSLARLPGSSLRAHAQVSSAAELGEVLADSMAEREVVVHVAEATLRHTTGNRPDDLVRAREEMYASSGLQFPDVRLVPTSDAPGTVQVRLNDVTLSAQHLAQTAHWADVVALVMQELYEHGHWFIRMADVRDALDNLSDVLPDLVELADKCYSTALLAAFLRELARDGQSIRNLPRILWLLLEAGSSGAGSDVVRLSQTPLLPAMGSLPVVQHDPAVLASASRKRVTEERWRAGGAERAAAMIRIPREVEDALLDPPSRSALAEAEWRVLAAVGILDHPAMLVARSRASLRPLRTALQALPQPPHIIASHELPPDASLPPDTS